jgi:DNA modification methylase
MERIIAATSNKGDLVVDMFAGTGASGVVAKQLQRNWLGFDLSKVCVRESNARIAKATVTT